MSVTTEAPSRNEANGAMTSAKIPVEPTSAAEDVGAAGNGATKKTAKKNMGIVPGTANVVRATATPLFELRVRGMAQPDASAQVVTAASAAEAFDIALGMNIAKMVEPVIVWSDRNGAISVDIDRPTVAPPLTDADVERLMTANAPKPYAAWVTHGGGLRVIFVAVGGVSARALLLAWLMLAPLGPLVAHPWRLELKTDTRHPLGLRAGATCGRVIDYVPTATFSFRATEGATSDADVQAWLSAGAMHIGGRYGTDKCPWTCGPSSGNAPVAIMRDGVWCHRCKHGARWWELLGTGDGVELETYRALRAFVHVAHQEHVLLARYPYLTRELIAAGYAFLLRGVHAERLNGPKGKKYEARIKKASAPHPLDIVRSATGAWLDAKTLDPRRVTGAKTLKYLPWCFSPPQVEKAENAGPLDGFVTVQPIGAVEVLAPTARPPRGSIFVPRPRVEDDPPPVELAQRPTPQTVEDAWVVLNAAFPGINRGYHVGIIIAMLVAQRAVGTPPTLMVTGQSGSAKNGQLHLAAGAIGSKAVPITLGATDDTNRKIGLALEEGAGAVFVDEIGRVDGLFGKVEPLLSANTEIAYRPKFANERRAQMRAAIFILGSTMPASIVKSPELARRAVAYRLTGASKVWSISDPTTGEKLDFRQARRDPLVRPALDIVTASAWWKLHDLGAGGDWRRLLLDEHGAVELPHLDLLDGDGSERKAAIRALYERYRTAPEQELTKTRGHAGWLRADRGTMAGSDLGVLIDFDGDTSRFTAETSELERLDLAPFLGFSEPHLQMYVRRRAPNVIVKFVQTSGMRGRGVAREKLPPLAPDSDPSEMHGIDETPVTV